MIITCNNPNHDGHRDAGTPCERDSLHVWADGFHTTISSSAEEHIASRPCIDGDADEYVPAQVDDEHEITIWCNPKTMEPCEHYGGARVTMRARDWVLVRGRGYLCSSDT